MLVLQAPTQARARDTLDRLLTALAAMLRDRPFEQISVAALARAAGVTTGAIFARFPDKISLLVELDARLARVMEPAFVPVLDAAAWATRPLHTSMREVFRVATAFYREHAGVIRTLSAQAASNTVLKTQVEAANRQRVDRLVTCVLRAPDRPRGRHARRDIEFATLLTTSALREATLFSAFWPGGLGMSDAQLATSLADAFCGYLHAKERR
jgi:AcrR family transcriptional regulator